MKVKKFLLPGLFLVSAVTTWPACGQIYRCVDADDHVTYSNMMKKSKESCTRVEIIQDSAMPARAQTGPVRAVTTSRIQGPATFPRVTEDEQKKRENDRRAILEQEFSDELKKLAQAQRELEEQQNRKGDTKPQEERVAQHQRNVDALNKEIANLK
ncbi:MAG: DUF4124 domain-containing protein [Zoogloeaceae bacterium]|jgi:hypothetical protein|nr:DUF4124 domain-containing protein [Zoogloeaceae bacterium]